MSDQSHILEEEANDAQYKRSNSFTRATNKRLETLVEQEEVGKNNLSSAD